MPKTIKTPEIEKVEKKVKDPIEKFTKDSRRDIKEFTNDSYKQIREMSDYLKDWIKDANSRLKSIDTHLEAYEKKLTTLTQLNVSIEETLGNVLLAIRQNEYLQAWYPEQQGHGEMKVIGRHPCQAKEKI